MDRIAFIVGEKFLFWGPIIITLAALSAAIVFLGLYIGKGGNVMGGFVAVPLCVVASMFLGRLIHWYCRTDYYSSFTDAITNYTSGEYALLGVFVGCLLVACLLRLIQATKNLPLMLDCMCVAGAVGIGAGRMMHMFGSSDRGEIIESITELPIVYPVTNAVTGVAEYRLATFMLQAIVAGIIFLILLVFFVTGKRRHGDTCLLFLLFYGATQAILDSTRYDSLFLRSNGFVSIVQILGAAALVFSIVVFSIRMVRAMGWRPWFLALWIGILGLLGGAGYMEYFVQRHGNKALFAYSVMGSCLLLVVLIGLVIYGLELFALKRQRKEALLAQQVAALEEEEAAAEEVAQPAEEEVTAEAQEETQPPEETAETVEEDAATPEAEAVTSEDEAATAVEVGVADGVE